MKYITVIILMLLLIATQAARAGFQLQSIMTDQARYAPGEMVEFTVQMTELPAAAVLRISYLHLNATIGVETIAVASNPVSWTWQPPSSDYQGYLTRIVLDNNSALLDTTWIAVDVSSNWSRFPRYGFISDYSQMSEADISNVMAALNRCHINGLQFYDWHYKHHMPLKGTIDNPAPFWNDIANRTNYYATVAAYIRAAHERRMMVLSYNLLFGAYQNAAADGVANEWRLFKDRNHSQPDVHDLPASWASDIYLIDPSNPLWISHIMTKTNDALSVFDFDGWHIDQLGDRGVLYDYYGRQISLTDAYLPFIQQAKNSLNCSLVMNAVNQFGQAQIAAAPVDFLYTEVWSPHDSYSSLATLIQQNSSWSNGKLATVLAAYVNKARSTQPGILNTPAVLLTDAVIFAAGGAHIELGEHMLANEYFPNNQLQMSSDLQQKIIAYYDFLVAYQNLLRDGGTYGGAILQSESEVSIRNIARLGSIWCFAKEIEHRRIFHLINFIDAVSLNWRDDGGNQPAPHRLTNIPVSFSSTRRVASLWMSSPDIDGGNPQPIPFTQNGETVRFFLPALEYWDMVVAEFAPAGVPSQSSFPCEDFICDAGYPNPFNSRVHVRFHLINQAFITVGVYNSIGQWVKTITAQEFSAGSHVVVWSPEEATASGVYQLTFRRADGAILQQKINYVK